MKLFSTAHLTLNQRCIYSSLIIFICSLGQLAVAAPLYHITEIGSLTDGDYVGTFVSCSISINNAGEVALSSVRYPGKSHAYRLKPNQHLSPDTDELGPLEQEIYVQAINDVGQVIGSYHNHIFRTLPRQNIDVTRDDLGTLGGGTGYLDISAINNSGQVVGESTAADGRVRAYRTQPNQAINPETDNLGGGSYSSAEGINDAGQVVGVSWSDYPNRVMHGFRTAPNARINMATDDLGGLTGEGTRPSGINASGQVVGWCIFNSMVHHAFRTSPNMPINPETDDLGTLNGGYSSEAIAINNAGDVVGNTDRGPFLYTQGVMYSLGSLIGSNSDWKQLRSAAAIYDKNQIVGCGEFQDGKAHYFRMDLITP